MRLNNALDACARLVVALGVASLSLACNNRDHDSKPGPPMVGPSIPSANLVMDAGSATDETRVGRLEGEFEKSFDTRCERQPSREKEVAEALLGVDADASAPSIRLLTLKCSCVLCRAEFDIEPTLERSYSNTLFAPTGGIQRMSMRGEYVRVSQAYPHARLFLYLR